MSALYTMISIMAPIMIFGILLQILTTPGEKAAALAEAEELQRKHPKQYAKQYPKRNVSYYHIPLVSEEHKTGMQIFFAVLVGGISLAVILSNW